MKAWEHFLKLQEAELGEETVQKWLRNLRVTHYDNDNLYLEAKDSFQALWFEEHARSKAQAQLHNSQQKKIKIHVKVVNAPDAKKRNGGKFAKKGERFEGTPFTLTFDSLDPQCTFDRFIITDDNTRVANQLIFETATSQQCTYNPIYIHGCTGSGKTHLLMSAAHALREQGLKTVYTHAETFTDHVVSAIRSGEMSVFRQAYRHIDVLLVDDVHVFSRKGATQEEFFHTFNTLHLAGKQIILSANCSPQELQLIEPRLISRFEWGIALPLQPIPAEGLKQLLEIKTKALQFPLPADVADFLTETFRSSPKSLVRALEALVLRTHLDSDHLHASLTIPAIMVLLKDLLLLEEQSSITPTKIIQAVAEHHGIRSEDVLGKAQTRDCVIPRQLAMYLCRHQLKLPFMKIGELFSRDHSTVMASVKHIQKKKDENDPAVVNAWHAILKQLQS